jgi:hypothetical protein
MADDLGILTVQEVAEMLKSSTSWVYKIQNELGGFKVGGKLFFTKEGIAHAIETGQELARLRDDRREKVSTSFRNERRGKNLRSRNQKTDQSVVDQGTDPRRYGLASILFEISRLR